MRTTSRHRAEREDFLKPGWRRKEVRLFGVSYIFDSGLDYCCVLFLTPQPPERTNKNELPKLTLRTILQYLGGPHEAKLRAMSREVAQPATAGFSCLQCGAPCRTSAHLMEKQFTLYLHLHRHAERP